MDPNFLAYFWAGVIAFAILVYVVLDGYDLGVGVLFGTTRDATHRDHMMASIAPFWDGNETWLVVVGASLFGAFPVVYAVFLSAFYLPVLLLLFGLIFRGVAFEFRYRTERRRWLWDWGFFLGSTMAAFVQGAAIGAMIGGIPVTNGQYAGGAFDWVAPFPIFCGVGLVLGYALLGASWLVLKSDDDLREWAYRRIPWLVGGVVLVVIVAMLGTIDMRDRLERNIITDAWMTIFPALGALALIGVLVGAWKRRDGWPFAMSAMFFLMAFLTLAAMFWPYMIPYSITVANAAAPAQSLEFMFYAGVVVLPVIIIYSAVVYWIFRGKLRQHYS
jgi:cytochrome d ubiquinol oxidase subunit II